jgi:hypothetical protein
MELVNLIDEGHLFLDQQTKAPKYVSENQKHF